jgi:hypothetical protein
VPRCRRACKSRPTRISALEVFDPEHKRPIGIDEISLARLVNERAMEERLRYGSAIVDDYLYSYNTDDSWVHQMASWLIPAIAGRGRAILVSDPPEGTSDADVTMIAGLIFRYFRTAKPDNIDRDIELLRLLFRLPAVFEFDHPTLAGLALTPSDELVAELPEPDNAKVYGPFTALIQRVRASKQPPHIPTGKDLETFLNGLPDEAIPAAGIILRMWDSGNIARY